jgi:crotonobetainyl-CoA:carnitine CoA-transferase CaiB-like acyl-CoA transferase
VPGPLEGIKVVELGVWVAAPRWSTRSRTSLPTDRFHVAGGVVFVPDGESAQPMMATPTDFGGTLRRPRSTAQALGAHAEEILADPPRRESTK